MSAFRLVILAAIAAICALTSAASTVHHVRFAQPALILVWDDDAFLGQGERIDLTGIGAAERPDLMGSGDLIQSTETLGQSKTVTIASNTGFAIRSSIAVPNQAVSVRVLSVGENAQASGIEAVSETETLFQLSTRTAVRPGTPETQSITLEIEWTGTTAPNLYVTAL